MSTEHQPARDVHLRRLRYFVEVGRRLSFSQAAAALHTSQPNLSKQIRQLENELGIVLLQRTTRQVVLTEQGLHLLADATELIRRWDTTRSRICGE